LLIEAQHNFIDSDDEWELWKLLNNKSYASLEEDSKRMEIYFQNKKMTDDLNQRFSEGKQSFSCSVYSFSDLTIDEFNDENMGLGSIEWVVYSVAFH
jgi:hypothetical protein